MAPVCVGKPLGSHTVRETNKGWGMTNREEHLTHLDNWHAHEAQELLAVILMLLCHVHSALAVAIHIINIACGATYHHGW